MSKVKAVPDMRGGVIATITIDGARKAMEFWKKAFGATSADCMESQDGKVAHAEVQLAGGVLMVNDVFPEWNCHAAQNVRLFFYCDNVDQVVERAVKAGCTLVRPVEDQFWGDRMGNVRDPFGIEWGIATHVKDLTPEQIKKAGQEWLENAAKQKQTA